MQRKHLVTFKEDQAETQIEDTTRQDAAGPREGFVFGLGGRDVVPLHADEVDIDGDAAVGRLQLLGAVAARHAVQECLVCRVVQPSRFPCQTTASYTFE